MLSIGGWCMLNGLHSVSFVLEGSWVKGGESEFVEGLDLLVLFFGLVFAAITSLAEGEVKVVAVVADPISLSLHYILTVLVGVLPWRALEAVHFWILRILNL